MSTNRAIVHMVSTTPESQSPRLASTRVRWDN